MHAGLCLLRLSPEVFWRLTPVEFFAMAGGLRPAAGAIGRAGLEGLMKRFPDKDVRPF
jgi:phage conserved hypothetical protein